MTKEKQIPKAPGQRVRDCEAHLFFVWDCLRLYPQQPDRYKQIAAELRVLVCKSKQNHPLLLDLMDEYRFSYCVDPPPAPFDKLPIPMVGWRDDPVHQQLCARLEQATGDPEALATVLEAQAPMRRSVPLREYVDRALAVYIAPREYSYKQLTLTIAQKMGSGHEDAAVPESVVRMQAVTIGGHGGHIAPLLEFAKLIVRVGSEFLGLMAPSHGFEPRYFSK